MRWQHDSDLDDTHALAEHLAALFTVLGSRTNELRALWLDHDLTLTCVGHYPSWTHGLYLDREVVRQAASLGLALDLDFYFVRDHEEEPRATLPSGS